MDKKSKEKPPKHRSQRHRIQLDGNSLSSAVSTRETRSSTNRLRATESANQHHVVASSLPDRDATQNQRADMSTSIPATSEQSQPHTSSPGPTTSAASPTGSGSQSPEPNCPICLGKLENKSFTNSCFHMFCFLCLLEWSKVKAECPLCKQSFKSIVHNVRSDLDYDEYYIQQPERIERPTFEFAAPGGIRFRYRTTVTDHRYTRRAEEIEREIQERLLARPSHRHVTSNYRRLRQPATSDFRRRVYLDRLKPTNSSDRNTRRRVRETSPSFFRENAAQTHRLVPWLNRELNALLRDHGDHLAFVLDLIMGLIMRHSIDSAEFYQHVYPFVGHYTRQFQQEFLMFARSPYHMAAYDRHTNYELNTDPPAIDNSDSDHQPPSDGNDSDIIVVSPASSPQQQQRRDNAPRRISPHDLNIQPFMQDFINRFTPSTTDLHRPQPPTATSGWDSPIRSPGWNIPTDSSSEDVDIINLHHTDPSSTSTSDISPSLSTASSFLSSSGLTFARQLFPFGCLQPSVSPYYNPLFSNPGGCTTSISCPLPSILPLPPPPVAVPSTSTDCPINVDQHESDSNESDVMIVDYEKPWLERSPIALSSEESDFDIRITGEHRPGDPLIVKSERRNKKRKHEESEQTERSTLNLPDSAVLNPHESSDREDHSSRSKSHHKSSKRQRHHTKSRSPDDQNDCRNPLLLQLFDIPQYKHKMYSKSRRDTSSRSKDRHSRDSKYSRDSSRSSRSSGGSSQRRSHRSSSQSDSESRVSIRSHKRRSTHSSIEIVEYRKHNTKHKKAKKHKRKHSDEHGSERGRHGHSSSSRHRKPSKSSKSSRHSHKHSRNKSNTLSDSSCDEMNRKRRDPVSMYFDDSDTEDYAVSNVGSKDITNTSKQKSQNNYADKGNSETNKDVNKPNDFNDYYDKYLNLGAESSRTNTLQNYPPVDVRNLEVVELPLDQTGYFDKDLEMLAKSLANREQESSGSKPFKKHPHGHKKSKKTAEASGTASNNSGTAAAVKTTMEDVVNKILGRESATTYSAGDENIQSNLISSCTEGIETTGSAATTESHERNSGQSASTHSLCIPTYYTSQYKVGQISNTESPNSTEQMTCSENTNNQKTHGDHLSMAESVCQGDTSSIYRKVDAPLYVGCTQNDSELIDVDTISENSDIDVTGSADMHDYFLAVPSYRTSRSASAGYVDTAADIIDVVGVSDEENKEDRKNENQTPYVDVLGFSETESLSSNEDIEVTKIDKPTEVEIDITGLSDDDHIHVQTINSAENLDIVGNGDNIDGGHSRAKHSSGDDLRITGTTAPKPVVLDSDSDDMTIDSNDDMVIDVVDVPADEKLKQSSCILADTVSQPTLEKGCERSYNNSTQFERLASQVIDDNISFTTIKDQVKSCDYANSCLMDISPDSRNRNVNSACNSTFYQCGTNDGHPDVPAISCLRNPEYSPTRQLSDCSAYLRKDQYDPTVTVNQNYDYYLTGPSPRSDIDGSPRPHSHSHGSPYYSGNSQIVPTISYSTAAGSCSETYSSLAGSSGEIRRSDCPAIGTYSSAVGSYSTSAMLNSTASSSTPITVLPETPDHCCSKSSYESDSSQSSSSDSSPHQYLPSVPINIDAQHHSRLPEGRDQPSFDARLLPVVSSTPPYKIGSDTDVTCLTEQPESGTCTSVRDPEFKDDTVHDRHRIVDNADSNAGVTESLCDISHSSECPSPRSHIGSSCNESTDCDSSALESVASDNSDTSMDCRTPNSTDLESNPTKSTNQHDSTDFELNLPFSTDLESRVPNNHDLVSNPNITPDHESSSPMCNFTIGSPST